jgi:hypothetical protein
MTDSAPILYCKSKADFAKWLDESGAVKPDELKMRGELPSTREEFAQHALYHGLEVREDATVPPNLVLMKDSRGHIIRQFYI